MTHSEAAAEATRRNLKHCAGTRRDGQPCTAPVLGTAEHCYAHDPARTQDRANARARGGQNRSNAVRLGGLVPPRLMGIYDRLEGALEEVHAGTLEPRQATAMAALAGALVKVLTAGELEQRVRDLEGKGSA